MAWVTFVSIMVMIAGVYLAVGLLFAFYCAFFAVGKIDPAAKNGTWGFRLLIIPGMTVLWPLLLMRLLKGVHTPPIEQNAHRKRAGGGV